MGPKKSLLSGLVAFVAASAVARTVRGKRLGARIGLLIGGSVALSTWLSGRKRESEIEFEEELAAE